MNKILYFWIFILLIVISQYSACSQDTTFTAIAPEANIYVLDFAKSYGHYISSLQVIFVDTPLDESADCRIEDNGQKVIRISKKDWNGYCVEQRRGLIFHELGHCVLGRSHTDIELSFMYPAMRSCEFYMNNMQTLDQEMFK